MSFREVVICTPFRTAIGSAKRSTERCLQAAAVGGLRSRRCSNAQVWTRAKIGTVVGQCPPGRQPDEPGASSSGQWRGARRGARHDGEPGLRLGRAGSHHGRAGDLPRLDRLRHGRRNGAHGHGALPDSRRSVGPSARAPTAPRCGAVNADLNLPRVQRQFPTSAPGDQPVSDPSLRSSVAGRGASAAAEA